eukprot:COSAG02_NODE_59768_length_273_cov_0.609195_1_plen_76_part_10
MLALRVVRHPSIVDGAVAQLRVRYLGPTAGTEGGFLQVRSCTRPACSLSLSLSLCVCVCVCVFFSLGLARARSLSL